MQHTRRLKTEITDTRTTLGGEARFRYSVGRGNRDHPHVPWLIRSVNSVLLVIVTGQYVNESEVITRKH